jgi:hypothetical protein
LNGRLLDGITTTANTPIVYDFTGREPVTAVVGGTVDQISLIPNAPALIHAGGNITFPSQRPTSPFETGIRALGNSIDTTAYPIYGSPD